MASNLPSLPVIDVVWSVGGGTCGESRRVEARVPATPGTAADQQDVAPDRQTVAYRTNRRGVGVGHVDRDLGQ
jgi:hypothetical protein